MMQPTSSIAAIRRRLSLTLLRAFVIVLLIMVVLILASVAQQLSLATSRNPFYRSPLVSLLESYYLGRGNWEGVQILVPFDKAFEREWQRMVLVDRNGRIVLDRGRVDSSRIGSIYQPQAGDHLVVLQVNGQRVGNLYMARAFAPHPWPFILNLLSSTALIAVFLGLLTLVIGMLLMRRFVTPLAEVIAASQEVAAGNLSVRVPLQTRHDDLRALGEHFNAMAEALERHEQERQALFADIAHELRTPLTILKGRLEGILDGVYPADEVQIADALGETYLLERLVEDLRLLALAESRQLHFEKQEVDAQEIVRRTLNLFEPQAAERGITFRMQAEPLPALYVDPQRMAQVLGNILDNALRFSPDDGQIDVVLRPVEDGVEISVSDQGPGVAEEDLPWIFQRFWRGDKSRSRSSGGAGLGLAIARQLVEGQGGHISAHRAPAGGLQIRLILPAVSRSSD